jgi:Ca2+-binding RTX toxin-like protein
MYGSSPSDAEIDDRDFFCGNDGADLFRPYGGADQIDGGSENDNAVTGPGPDYVRTYAGADYIWGQGFEDDLGGGEGNDQIYGGAGGDAINGGYGDDIIYGESGYDNIDGGPGFDTCYRGGEGASTVRCEKVSASPNCPLLQLAACLTLEGEDDGEYDPTTVLPLPDSDVLGPEEELGMLPSTPDLKLEVEESNDPVVAQLEFTHTVRVTNGSGDAVTSHLEATLSGDLTIPAGIDSSQGQCWSGNAGAQARTWTVSCQLDRLPSGATATVTIPIILNSGLAVVFNGYAFSPDGESYPSDNLATETTYAILNSPR